MTLSAALAHPHDSAMTREVDQLLDLAAALRELSGSLEQVHLIPALLASQTNMNPVALAILETMADQDPRIVVLAASGLATGPELERRVLELAAHPRDTAEALAGRRVLVREIDETRQLVLIAPVPTDAAALDVASVLAGYLARLLRATVSWQSYPTVLGEPFDRLTEREWMVLCGLNSDDGEKQLADRLQLSPHTLHSHIKSIYRKMGVQGRLPLLQRLDAAVRAYRLRLLGVTGLDASSQP